MALGLLPWISLRFDDDEGVPLAGGSVLSYVTGTTDPKDTFFDADGDVSHLNANPIPLDAGGRPESGGIFLEAGAYDFVVRDANDVELYTISGIQTQPETTDTGGGGSETPGQVVASALKLEVQSVTWSTSQNNVSLLNDPKSAILRVNNTVATDAVTGFLRVGGNFMGDWFTLTNVGAAKIILKQNSGSSTAGNRILMTGDLADININPNRSMTCWYDGTSLAWRADGGIN